MWSGEVPWALVDPTGPVVLRKLFESSCFSVVFISLFHQFSSIQQILYIIRKPCTGSKTWCYYGYEADQIGLLIKEISGFQSFNFLYYFTRSHPCSTYYTIYKSPSQAVHHGAIMVSIFLILHSKSKASITPVTASGRWHTKADMMLYCST